MSDWFVVRAKSREEERAAWHLGNQGFETYLPRYKKTIRHARKTQHVLRPLFPGYLFVSMDSSQKRWRSINGTVGVQSLVEFGGGPMPINEIVIDAIRDRENGDGIVSLAPQGLQKGDAIRVREGAFLDHVGLLEEVCDENRVILLLNLMGREVRVHASVSNLAQVS